MNNHQFKKKFGQNFIKDKNLLKKIVSIADPKKEDLVIEIGAGSGELTEEIEKYSRVISYEIDSDLEETLNSRFKDKDVEVIIDDILKRNIKEDIAKYKYKNLYVIANLPYYITTPIINKLIDEKIEIEKLVLMVQKEVGERFTASIKSKSYSSITVFLNYFFNIKKEFNVSRELFFPKPDVDSMIISFSKREKEKVENEELFYKIIRDSFKQKRKTLKNNLKSYDWKKIEEVLDKHSLSSSVRAEEIPLKIFIEITKKLD